MASREGPRWPASVYGVGSEPDPRFSLANERTFLAWIRTTLALLVASAALSVVRLPLPAAVQEIAAGGLALFGAAAALQAWIGWARAERAMRVGQPLPGARMSAPLVGVMVLVAALLLMAAIPGPWR